MKTIPSYRLVLASASPRRRQILKDAGYSFEMADPGDAEEQAAIAPTPDALAMSKARAKAQFVAAHLSPPFPALVIGVDTLVAVGNEVIGKPADRRDAVAILTRLSGTRQRVISGICLWPLLAGAASGTAGIGSTELVEVLSAFKKATLRLEAASTCVTMRQMARTEIEAYVASGEADGKAGAYAVQETGDRFIEKIEGSFTNVVGFPLELFQQMFAAAEEELAEIVKKA
jgi:septum formation protein